MSNGLTLPFQQSQPSTGNLFEVTCTSGGGSGIAGSSFGTDQFKDAGSGVSGASDVGTGVDGSSKSGTGVSGSSQSGTGVFGSSLGSGAGVLGESASGVGVSGTSATSDAIKGVSQSSQNAGVSGQGVKFGGAFSSDQGVGVFSASNGNDAIRGKSQSSAHAGVSGTNTNGGFAFWGASDSTGGTGIFVRGQQQAAQFGDPGANNGDVTVNGTLNHNGNMTVNGILNVIDDIVLNRADFAEEFDVTADAEPGTVMVLDGEGAVKPSCVAYDRKVAGIISGAGEYRPAIILDKQASDAPRKALALVGKVYCKVDASYAPVEIGDMLTTSPRVGHAMKAVDAARSFGAVIGKALRPISAGEGLIPVLVALQ